MGSAPGSPTPTRATVTAMADGHGDWGDYDGPGEWRGPYYGPAYYGPPQACVSATGPYGYVSGSLCI